MPGMTDDDGYLKVALYGGASGLIYRGAIDCSANPNYPAATSGDIYVVSVAGKIGGAAGVNVIAGDMLFCKTTTAAGDHATVGSAWDIVETNVDFTNITFPMTMGTGGSLDMNNKGLTDVYQQEVVVAKSGGDYATITAALAAITDATTDKRYLIKVMPGTYSEAITMKAYVDIEGSGARVSIITRADATVVTMVANSTLRNIGVSLTNTTAARSAISSTGTLTDTYLENVDGNITNDYAHKGIYLCGDTGVTHTRVKVINCSIYPTASASGIYFGSGSVTAYTDCGVYNCRVIGGASGVVLFGRSAASRALLLTVKNLYSTSTNGINLTHSSTSAYVDMDVYDSSCTGGAYILAQAGATATLNAYGLKVSAVTKAGSGGTETFNSYGSVVGGTLFTGEGTGSSAGYTQISNKFITCGTFTSAGINAAIDALGATGGEVYLPEGDYDCTATITIDYNNTTLRGAGKGTRLLATNRTTFASYTGTPAAGETLTGVSSGYTAVIEKVDLTNKIVWYHTLSNAANFTTAETLNCSGGGTLVNIAACTEQSFDAITPGTCSGCKILNLRVVGGSGGGNSNSLIGSGAATDLQVDGCYFYSSDDMAVRAGGTGATVSHCFIANGDSRGIRLDGNYSKATSNTITNCKATSVELVGLYTSAIGNTVYAAAYNAIATNGATGALISGNNIFNTATGYNDIFVINDYCSITGNVCTGNDASDKGIYLDEADYCTVSGNVCSRHDVADIQIDNDCQNNAVYGNNCSSATPYVNNDTAQTIDISGALTASGDVASTHTVNITVNGVVYKLLATNV